MWPRWPDREITSDLRGLRQFKSDYPMARCVLLFGGERREYRDGTELLPVTEALADRGEGSSSRGREPDAGPIASHQSRATKAADSRSGVHGRLRYGRYSFVNDTRRQGMANLALSADVDQPSRGSRDRTARHDNLCRQCGRRKALCTRYTRKRRVNRHLRHDLCFQCRRALRDATRNPML